MWRILLIFLIIMTTIWGLLAKSLTDNETIEAAVARLIAVHEADETSHLGVGESLQSHKASEIIDHVVESIVEDKIATGAISSRCITSDQIIGKYFTTDATVGALQDGVKFDSSGLEMWQGGGRKVSIPKSGNADFAGVVRVRELQYLRRFWQNYFLTLDGLTQVGYGSVILGGFGISIKTDGVSGHSKSLYLADEVGSLFNSSDGDLSFETTVRLNLPANAEATFGVSNYQGVPTDWGGGSGGFGFTIKNSKVYGYIWEDNGTVHEYELMASVPTGFNVYRAYYTIGSSISFYINGELVLSHTTYLPPISAYIPFGYTIKETTTATHYLDTLYLTIEGPMPGG